MAQVRALSETTAVHRRIDQQQCKGQNEEKSEQDILFEEYTDTDAGRLLTGFNERYVRYGVPADIAEKRGYSAGNICRVPQECLECMP